MMKGVIKNTPLKTSKKKLTNHTARKTVMKNSEKQESRSRQSIIQVTGYASEKSLNDYDEGSEEEQQQLSNIISMTPQSAASSSSLDLPIWSFPPTTSTSKQSEHKRPCFHREQLSLNCQVTFNVVQGQCSSPKSVNH